MSTVLSYESKRHTLILRGVLDRKTLLPLWQQRAILLVDKIKIDVSQLQYVDSAGLALLVHLCAYQHQCGIELKIFGITDRLRTLVALYNLQSIIPIDVS
ncbi:anti-sigma-factor antagonist [Serratia symbiotica str. 'Cinara cedri']|nr:anti-sigma-factor antagonist [Serratia symbiotica str. 'Cinara cedri']